MIPQRDKEKQRQVYTRPVLTKQGNLKLVTAEWQHSCAGHTHKHGHGHESHGNGFGYGHDKVR